jgi:hypothetical protein
MSSPQQPAVRNKQKRRRTKQLAQWRARNAEKSGTTPAAKAPQVKSTKKPAAAKAETKAETPKKAEAAPAKKPAAKK